MALSLGTSDDGKRRRLQTTCKSRKEAAAKLHEWKAAQRDRVDLSQKNATISALIDTWLSNCERRVKPTTLHSYEQMVRLHVRPALGTLKIMAVTAQMLDRFFATKAEEGLGPSSVRYLKRLLHAIFEQAIDYDLVARNVVERTAKLPESKFQASFLTPEQMRLLLPVLPESVYGEYICVCLFTGMRPAEVRGLRWSDIDLHDDGGMIRVRQQIKDDLTGGGYLTQSPKTRKGRRDIPLPAVVARRLINYRRQVSEPSEVPENLVDQVPNPEWSDLVFRGTAGLPLNERYIRRIFKKCLEDAGLDPTIRLYDMRHTANVLLAETGASPEERREILGHSSLHMTIGVYGHATPDSKISAMQRLDNLLSE
ncbi:MAG: site-specific integrase [Armatimonas sp.]